MSVFTETESLYRAVPGWQTANVLMRRELGKLYWMELNRAKRVEGRQCIYRLIGKRPSHHCNGIGCVPCGDHPSLWRIDGKISLFVIQPYGILEREEMTAFCHDWGLQFTIDKAASWWMPGLTTLIAFTRTIK